MRRKRKRMRMRDRVSRQGQSMVIVMGFVATVLCITFVATWVQYSIHVCG